MLIIQDSGYRVEGAREAGGLGVEVLRAYLFEIPMAGNWVSRKAWSQCYCDSLKI